MKKQHYDVFVIGSGIAGQTVAEFCSKKGLSVAIADYREYGGTCANRGCDPKKILLQFTDLLNHSKNLKDVGIQILPKVDWAAVQAFKTKFTGPVPTKTERNLIELGINLYHQSPHFVSENEISVEGKNVTADYFVIATGQVPRKLTFKGAHYCQNSDDILNFKEPPESAIFIGSGYIAMEFSYMLASLGCKVTVVEKDNRALGPFDEFLVARLVEHLKSLGVDFIFDADASKIEKLRKNYRLHYSKKGKSHKIKANTIFNAAGRVPSIGELSLEKGNIQHNDKGIEVDDYLQSKTNPKVFACGDVSDKSVPLTPLSGLQGYIVGNNILKSKSKKFSVPCVPSTVFTYPQLSMVGYTEHGAKSKFKNLKIYQDDVGDWFNAKRKKEDVYAYKIIVNERTDEILGAHLLSSEANECINLFSTAIFNNMTVKEFKKLIFTYPSFSQDLKSMLADSSTIIKH
ncbi:MAG: NAD(P)/FAD-dependent oxidoreductase [Flavobacteriaceae bacterium]|nr:NAD(P)/FAD-dependent oxidoreductase [Flavobacteriaceae bacterium]